MDNIKDIVKTIEKYKGFVKPTTTPCPDDVFDIFLTKLSHAELKVLLYIVRRTFGFRKETDNISLKQIAGGIVTKKGRRLDSGAGVARRTAITVVKNLEKKGLITVKRKQTKDGYNFVNNYCLKFRG